jgi:predicted amidohydrolase
MPSLVPGSAPGEPITRLAPRHGRTLVDVKVAAVQHDIVWNDRQANFAHLAPLIRDAAACGADLVVLTETFSTGFVVDVAEVGEPEGGPSAQFLSAQAAEHGVWVCGSCPEVPDGNADGRPFNSFVFAGPDGTTHRYRKIHSFTYGGEPKYFRAGEELTTLDIAGARVTPLVCYDLRFADEFWQRAAGTDVYVVVANWPSPRRAHWKVLLQARAIENLAYVVGCNRVGSGGGLDYAGDSRVIDPLGELLATAAGDETTLLAQIDPQRVADVRARFGFLDDRR